MYSSLKQAIFRENRLCLSKVISNFVRKNRPGNMKKKCQTGTLYQEISRRPLGIKIRDWYQKLAEGM
jgi:hypothetical protein